MCIDVDGTLVGSSGVVLPAVWRAAEHVRSRGVRLAVCTGRPGFGLARGFAERLDSTGWHIFQNGASVVELPDGDTRSHSIPHDRVLQLVTLARAARRPLELYTDSRYAVEIDSDRTRRHAALLGVPFHPHDLLALTGPIVRAQWVVSHEEAAAVLHEPHDGLTVAHSLSPVMPDTSFLNITPEGVEKAGAVRAVAAAYGLDMSQVMMVGDGDNDVSAMRAVGTAVAMGNAEPAVLAAAHHRVAHVDEAGLVQALALALTL